ncbi:MAG: glycosyltransferase family 2 protein [Prochlorococcaceae cyanobacterium]|jgi:glycosyltransferase involved in cell wall biosynthesis
MDPLTDVTPLILTYNEEANIERTLAGLAWAERIVVIDSGSTDRTLELLAADPRVQAIHRPFDSHGQQWNFGLANVSSTWVLSLDADYVVNERLVMEIRRSLAVSTELAGYRIPFRYCVFGRPLRGTVLPPRIALFRRDAGHYIDDGHTQDLVLQGSCGTLSAPILHDDRKPLSRWLWAQERYLRLEVAKLRATPKHRLSRADRLRRGKILAPLAVLVICLVVKGGLLDGWRGWFYALQRAYVELLLCLMLIEADLRAEP